MFELLSGLAVNFNKCNVWGINVERDRLAEMARVVNCATGEGTLSYLGLNVVIEHRKMAAWAKLVDKIRIRLARWNDKQMYFGG